MSIGDEPLSEFARPMSLRLPDRTLLGVDIEYRNRIDMKHLSCGTFSANIKIVLRTTRRISMCDLANERIRINKILHDAIEDGFGEWSMKTDDLVQRCFLALQVYYDGSCVEECLKKKAEEFVSSYLARVRAVERSASADRPFG